MRLLDFALLLSKTVSNGLRYFIIAAQNGLTGLPINFSQVSQFANTKSLTNGDGFYVINGIVLRSNIKCINSRDNVIGLWKHRNLLLF